MISIVPCSSAQHAARVLDLADETFGPGYLRDVSDFIESPDALILMAVDRIHDAVAGFVLARVHEKGLRSLFEDVGHPSPRDLGEADEAGSLGVIRSISVGSEYQRGGIGLRLIKAAEETLVAMGATSIVVPAWLRRSGGEGTIALGGILAKQRYDRSALVEGYWKSECDNREFVCPERASHCSCAAVFFKNSTTR